MSDTTGLHSGPKQDHHDLAEFGYEQQLYRHIGSFSSFAAGFSFVSILTTIFQLFGFGFGFGGPAFWWTWPVVFLFQFTVVLCFAELAARYPISGAIYQWSRRLGGETVGFFGGWFMILAQIVTAAAAAIALQVVLPTIWSGFQLVGTDTALTSKDGATNAVILGSVLLVMTTAINSIGIRWMVYVNAAGVVCELVGVAATVLALFSHSQRGPGVVLSLGEHAGKPGYLAAWITSGLMAAYVMVGFDSASELSEETRNPRLTAPRTIRLALSVSALFGGLLLLGSLMAAPSLTDGRLSTDGLPYVLDAVLGSFWGKVLLADVGIAICVCTLAIQTAGSRLLFSMARDERLPFSHRFAHVNPVTGTPIAPAVIIGVGCLLVLLVNVGNGALFTTLTSVCIILIYCAYLLVTVPMLWRRLRGWKGTAGMTDALGEPLFSLGRWGLPINIVAVAYGVLMMINLAWPRAEIFNPDGTHPVMQWAGPISIGACLVAGILAYPRRRPHPKPVILGE